MVPITVGIASPKGSIAYDSLSRTLLASKGVYAAVGISAETASIDANRGVGLIVGYVLDRTDAAWIRQLRSNGDTTPVLAVCRPSAARFAIAAGADGVLGFDDERADLEGAIVACARGGRWIPAGLEQESLAEPVGVPIAEIDEVEAETSDLADIVALARSRATA